MSGKKKNKVVKDTSERWLLTYSDLMNLLLILFIILYVSSKSDTAKFQQVAESLRQGFSVISTGDVSVAGGGSGGGGEGGTGEFTVGDSSGGEGSYEAFYTTLEGYLQEYDLGNEVSLALSSRGAVISFADNALFAPGEAQIDKNSRNVLLKMGELLKKLPYSFILIEGHTDSVPIHNAKYEDNMDLSTQRAANVWRLLVSCGLPPEGMASIGYGEYRPAAPNDTAENRAKNRRVVVTILKKEQDPEAEDPGMDVILPDMG